MLRYHHFSKGRKQLGAEEGKLIFVAITIRFKED
jgi:hypothetical protein